MTTITDNPEKSPNADISDHEAKARELWDKICWIEVKGEEAIPIIVSALREAEATEREACARIAEDDNSFMMLQDFGLQSAVTQKGENIAAAIRSRSKTDE